MIGERVINGAARHTSALVFLNGAVVVATPVALVDPVGDWIRGGDAEDKILVVVEVPRQSSIIALLEQFCWLE